MKALLVTLLTHLLVVSGRTAARQDPEVTMNVSEIIEHWGYPVENYDVVTDDGYILTIQRIPHGRKSKDQDTVKPVVFLQHGLLGSSVHFVMNPYNESLGFILADTGFDVWLGNSRGNDYAKRHKTLSPHSDAFWDFSWDEFAKLDLPATLDHILAITGASTLSYIGHSQGTAIAFAEFSQNQTLASKINLFIALAPVAFVGHIESPLKYLAYLTGEIELLFKILGTQDFDLPKYIKDMFAELACEKELGEAVCGNIVFLLCGYDKAQLNETRLPVYAAQILGGTSVKDLVHFAQGVRSKKFCKYDYGSEGNMKHYGQNTAPSYNLSEVHVPTALFTGGNDWLADPTDVSLLVPHLPNVVFKYNIEAWDHIDFLVGQDAPQLIYTKIIKLLKQEQDGMFKHVSSHHSG